MQVKKFEAESIQDALESIKRELGPEAVILQTRKNRKGFGLMSRPSVEVTAAVSESALEKKRLLDSRLPKENKKKVNSLPAEKQAKMYNQYMDRQLERKARSAQDKVSIGNQIAKSQVEPEEDPVITATPYVDIRDDVETKGGIKKERMSRVKEMPVSQYRAHETRWETEVANQPQPSEQAPATDQEKSELQSELNELKLMILEMKKNSQQQPQPVIEKVIPEDTDAFSDPHFKEFYGQLLSNGVERRYVYQILSKVDSILSPEEKKDRNKVIEYVAAEIMNTTETISILDTDKVEGPIVLAMIGPTGVGKTTTIAKLASEAMINQNKKVALVNIDRYKISASDQLETYSKILNVPYRSVNKAEDLHRAIEELKGVDVIFLDTTGRSQKDVESINYMQEVLNSLPNIRVQLVLSNTTRDSELFEAGKRFANLRPQSIIFSKLDESTMFGAIYNTFQKLKLPLSYFTIGQRVPEDIEQATRERLVSLLLDL